MEKYEDSIVGKVNPTGHANFYCKASATSLAAYSALRFRVYIDPAYAASGCVWYVSIGDINPDNNNNATSVINVSGDHRVGSGTMITGWIEITVTKTAAPLVWQNGLNFIQINRVESTNKPILYSSIWGIK